MPMMPRIMGRGRMPGPMPQQRFAGPPPGGLQAVAPRPDMAAQQSQALQAALNSTPAPMAGNAPSLAPAAAPTTFGKNNGMSTEAQFGKSGGTQGMLGAMGAKAGGMKKGGAVKAKGWGKARGARAAKVY